MSMTVLAEEKVLFKMTDPVGDDYGPGTYLYPQHKQFKNNPGLFDLQDFKVIANQDDYIFHFRFGEITNPWHAPFGFSHQLIQVYLDSGRGGVRETFKEGANINFEKQHPWNQLIKITGWNVEIFSLTAERQEYKILEEAKVKLDDKLVQVFLPKEVLPNLSEAHYYVLIASLDGFNYDNYRKVTAQGGEWEFGGGTDSNLNPNVIDTLVPEGLDQKQVLGSFSLESGELATLYAVGPELSLPWKLVIIFSFCFILLLTILGAGLKIMRNFSGNSF